MPQDVIKQISAFSFLNSYDPEVDRWTTVQPMHAKRLGVGVAVVNRLLYAIGGFDGQERLPTVECYHPENNEWTMVPPMKYGRSGAGVAAIHQHIYVVGGFDGTRQLDSVERYDTELQTWELVAPIKIARSALSLTVLDGKLYAMGGYDGHNFLGIVDVYDPVSNTWQEGTPLTSGRSGHASAVIYASSCITNYLENLNITGDTRGRKGDKGNDGDCGFPSGGGVERMECEASSSRGPPAGRDGQYRTHSYDLKVEENGDDEYNDSELMKSLCSNVPCNCSNIAIKKFKTDSDAKWQNGMNDLTMESDPIDCGGNEEEAMKNLTLADYTIPSAVPVPSERNGPDIPSACSNDNNNSEPVSPDKKQCPLYKGKVKRKACNGSFKDNCALLRLKKQITCLVSSIVSSPVAPPVNPCLTAGDECSYPQSTSPDSPLLPDSDPTDQPPGDSSFHSMP